MNSPHIGLHSSFLLRRFVVSPNQAARSHGGVALA